MITGSAASLLLGGASALNRYSMFRGLQNVLGGGLLAPPSLRPPDASPFPAVPTESTAPPASPPPSPFRAEPSGPPAGVSESIAGEPQLCARKRRVRARVFLSERSMFGMASSYGALCRLHSCEGLPSGTSTTSPSP